MSRPARPALPGSRDAAEHCRCPPSRADSGAARVARTAVERARAEGMAAGLFRPITLWPFPSEALRVAARGARAVLVVELSAGQLVEDVRLALDGAVPVLFHGRMGGMVPSPDEVVAAARRAWPVAEPQAPEGPHAAPEGGER